MQKITDQDIPFDMVQGEDRSTPDEISGRGQNPMDLVKEMEAIT